MRYIASVPRLLTYKQMVYDYLPSSQCIEMAMRHGRPIPHGSPYIFTDIPVGFVFAPPGRKSYDGLARPAQLPEIAFMNVSFSPSWSSNLAAMDKPILGVLLAACLLIASLSVFARDYGQFGPFDYYDLKNTPSNALPLVESGHFGPKTQDLARQKNWCFYWGDLDYTLRAFPNHPGALVAMADFLREHQSCAKPPAEKRSAVDLAKELESGTWQEKDADYYFRQALKFRPQYAATRVLYARYLQTERRRDKALNTLLEAEKLDPQSADVHYYLGLYYLEKGDNEKAKLHGEKAYRFGQSLPDLRDKLTKAGLWKTK